MENTNTMQANYNFGDSVKLNNSRFLPNYLQGICVNVIRQENNNIYITYNKEDYKINIEGIDKKIVCPKDIKFYVFLNVNNGKDCKLVRCGNNLNEAIKTFKEMTIYENLSYLAIGLYSDDIVSEIDFFICDKEKKFRLSNDSKYTAFNCNSLITNNLSKILLNRFTY